MLASPSTALSFPRMMSGPGLWLAFGLVLLNCKSQPVQSPEAKAAQEQCPSSEHVLADIQAMEGTVGALNSLSASPSTQDTSRCTVEVQLGKGSVLWADGALEYQRSDGAWKLVNSNPSFHKTAAGHIASVEALADETCACESEACLKDVDAKGARTIDVKRVLDIFREDPALLKRIETQVKDCHERIRGIDATKSSIHQTKAAEARQLVKKMSDAARVYYSTPAVTGQSRTLPDSAGPTPSLGSCCDNGGQCQGSLDDWGHPTWLSLDFGIQFPHFYSYEFEAGLSEDGKLRYTAIAHGDLDCDGVYSRFRIYGEEVDGEMFTSELLEDNPLE